MAAVLEASPAADVPQGGAFLFQHPGGITTPESFTE